MQSRLQYFTSMNIIIFRSDGTQQKCLPDVARRSHVDPSLRETLFPTETLELPILKVR
jgi:hypothetical protein